MHKSLAIFLLLGTLLLTGCGGAAANEATSPASTAAAAATATEAPLTPTPAEPLALVVNGEGIPQRVFTAELQRLRQAAAFTGPDDPEQQTALVRQYLIDQTLLAQAARQAGYTVDEAALEARVQELERSLGAEPFAAWLAEMHYTPEDFRAALRRDLEAAWMRDQIIAAVPAEMEQVHLFQILLYNEEDARQTAQQLAAGADFLTLARQYDPQTGGDLGWLPPALLLSPSLAQAVAALPAETPSDPLADESGYHLFYIQAREIRPLAAQARLRLQQQALQDWLDEQRAASDILIAP